MKDANYDALPPFVASSVPKSGTHLIHQILNGMPGVHNDITNLETKFFSNNPPEGFFEDHRRRLSALNNNEFGIGHLHYSKQYKDLLDQYSLKHIFIYRDPRDVIVSLAYFIPDKWGTHPLHSPFKNLSIKQRLTTLINGIPGRFPNFKQYFGPYYGWISEPSCLKIRFEDLVGIIPNRRRAIKSIADYLWNGLTPPVPLGEMLQMMENNIEPNKSRTFRQGRIGSWKKEFDEETKKLFKSVMGDLVTEMGYEENRNW